jgi:RNA polymerase sigma-54 factor
VDVERNVVVPDVIVVNTGKGGAFNFRVRLNADVMPRLRVHDIYANALRQHKGGGKESSNYAALQQRLQEARWFIKNIQQRFDTILRVSNAIVERQKSFFMHGELAMRPLVLREIADELGLHESTISRVTTAKYMATPYGTFELKYFFGSGLGTDSGSNASSTAVRALIKQFIGAESPKKPLSDNQLAEMLKEQGIDCARRTVAKYREGLRIAPASLRKAL